MMKMMVFIAYLIVNCFSSIAQVDTITWKVIRGANDPSLEQQLVYTKGILHINDSFEISKNILDSIITKWGKKMGYIYRVNGINVVPRTQKTVYFKGSKYRIYQIDIYIGDDISDMTENVVLYNKKLGIIMKVSPELVWYIVSKNSRYRATPFVNKDTLDGFTNRIINKFYKND